MNLINEILIKIKVILFFIIIVIEAFLFGIVMTYYKFVYIRTFELTKNYTINKTISTAKTLNDLLKINLYRYLCDLKLIGKHMSFLGNTKNDSKYIRKPSNYYKNILLDEDKQIVYGTMEELKKIKSLSKFYNSELKKFDYISYYSKEYIDNGKQSQIIKYLKNKDIHPELNMIAYYKLNGNTNINLLNENKRRAAKYIISIFKTNIIKRFITRGINFEFMNYLLLIDDEIYIYPPEVFNNTHLFLISDLYLFNCGHNNALKTFPKCVYDYVNNRENNFTSQIPGFIRPSMFKSKLNYNELSINFCMNIPFEKDLDLINLKYNPFLCQELNLTKFFNTVLFEQKDAFEFIFFFLDTENKNDIIPIYNDKKERYELIKNIFNDDKFSNYKISKNSLYKKI